MEDKEKDEAQEPKEVEVQTTTVSAAPIGRNKWNEKLKSLFPDKEVDYDDDESFYSALDEYAGERDEQLKRYADDNEKLFNAFDKDPRIGAVLADTIEEGDLMKSLINHYGADFKKIIEDPDYLEIVRKRDEEDQALKDLILANREKNASVADNFVKEKGMDEEEIAKFNEFINDVTRRNIEYDYDDDFLKKLYKAYKYDEAVQDAMEQGEIKGRNENIEMKLKDMEKSDGVPTPEVASSEQVVETQRIPRRRRSVWED